MRLISSKSIEKKSLTSIFNALLLGQLGQLPNQYIIIIFSSLSAQSKNYVVFYSQLL